MCEDPIGFSERRLKAIIESVIILERDMVDLALDEGGCPEFRLSLFKCLAKLSGDMRGYINIFSCLPNWKEVVEPYQAHTKELNERVEEIPLPSGEQWIDWDQVFPT